jgi:hypothetical protein
VTPFTGPGAAQDPAHEALRRHLVLLAAETPAVDVPGVTGEILRTARRRRMRRRVRATIAGIAAAALVGTAVIAGMSALVGGIQDSARRTNSDPQAIGDGGDSQDQEAQDVPDELPSSVDHPIRYAYRHYCEDDSGDPGACANWRVVTTTGDEWRIPGADDRGGGQLFTVSGDGNRLAYYDTSATAVVMVDRRHTGPQVSDLIMDVDRPDYQTELAFSHTGRWLAVDFGESEGAHLPRLHDFSTNRSWDLPRSLRILAVSDDGTVTATATDDVRDLPGHIHTTTLLRMRPDGHVLTRVRVEPELLRGGGALSHHGEVLAVTGDPAHPGDDEHGLLVTLDARTGRTITLSEADLPTYTYISQILGWVNEHEVLIEASSDDDDYYIYAVDPTTGTTRAIPLDDADEVPDVWAAGTLG